MRIKRFIFVGLISFVAVNGFCQEYYNMPVNWAFVEEARGSYEKGVYYLNMSFTLKMDRQNYSHRFDENGAWLKDNEQSPVKIDFTGAMKGEYINFNYSPKGSESFDILFREKDTLLKFKRNVQKDRFELVSATINHKLYVFDIKGEIPHLTILTNITKQVKPSYKVIPANSSTDNLPEVQPPTGRSRYIEGAGSLSVAGVVSYIIAQNPAVKRHDIERLIGTYFKEAHNERINHDIAIAQMLYATNFLTNRERMDNHNYAGLDPVGLGLIWFPDMQNGVRAHIQHLKGYASHNYPREKIVDPRFNILVSTGAQGTIRTFDELFPRWTQNYKNYGISINNILNGLYWFSASQRMY